MSDLDQKYLQRKYKRKFIRKLTKKKRKPTHKDASLKLSRLKYYIDQKLAKTQDIAEELFELDNILEDLKHLSIDSSKILPKPSTESNELLNWKIEIKESCLK